MSHPDHKWTSCPICGLIFIGKKDDFTPCPQCSEKKAAITMFEDDIPAQEKKPFYEKYYIDYIVGYSIIIGVLAGSIFGVMAVFHEGSEYFAEREARIRLQIQKRNKAAETALMEAEAAWEAEGWTRMAGEYWIKEIDHGIVIGRQRRWPDRLEFEELRPKTQ